MKVFKKKKKRGMGMIIKMRGQELNIVRVEMKRFVWVSGKRVGYVLDSLYLFDFLETLTHRQPTAKNHIPYLSIQ